METFDLVEMKIPAKAEYVGVARLSVSGIANRMGFSYEDIEDLKIAVSEAITNAVTHAYDSEGGEITIAFGIYNDRLEVIIADRGESFDLNKVKANIGPYNDETIDELKEGGFGLHLINALMDKVEINNDSGVVVLMTKYLEKIEVAIDEDRVSTR